MGKATGVFLILAGIGTAALVLPAVDKDAEKQLADVMRIATGNGASVATTAPQSVPSSGPEVPLVKSQRTAASSSAAKVAIARPLPGDQEPAQSPGGSSLSAMQATLATTPQPVLIPPPTLPVTKNANATPAKTDNSQARQMLARDIQRELKRVGCYDGELSGEWNSGTRRAMKTFIDKVNAALPSDEPDHILRTMVQGHPGNACGRGTIAAQVTPGSGASKAKLAEKPVEPPRDVAAAVPRDAGMLRPSVPRPAWETSVAVAPSTPLSAEGRMGMGGPIVPPVTTANAPVIATTADARGVRPVQQPLVSSVTTGSATMGASAASSAQATGMPGAIAALSLGTTRNETANDAALPKADRRVTVRRVDDVADLRDEAARRERQRQAARRSQPEPFKFPPSYVGASPKPYFVQNGASERSSFTQRFFDKLRRDGDLR